MSLEKPKYNVLFKDGDIEYRQYEPYLVSETIIQNVETSKEAGNEGFRRLFRYITGSNKSQAKIDMTAPVAQAPAGEKIDMTAPVQQADSPEGWSVSFMLPTKYTLETAPVPTDPRVRVREVPGRLMATLQYSGRWTESNYASKKSKLQKAIDAESVSTVGEMQTAFYNPPYTPPFLRRNEIMVEVSGLPAKAGDQIAAKQVAAY